MGQIKDELLADNTGVTLTLTLSLAQYLIRDGHSGQQDSAKY